MFCNMLTLLDSCTNISISSSLNVRLRFLFSVGRSMIDTCGRVLCSFGGAQFLIEGRVCADWLMAVTFDQYSRSAAITEHAYSKQTRVYHLPGNKRKSANRCWKLLCVSSDAWYLHFSCTCPAGSADPAPCHCWTESPKPAGCIRLTTSWSGGRSLTAHDANKGNRWLGQNYPFTSDTSQLGLFLIYCLSFRITQLLVWPAGSQVWNLHRDVGLGATTRFVFIHVFEQRARDPADKTV